MTMMMMMMEDTIKRERSMENEMNSDLPITTENFNEIEKEEQQQQQKQKFELNAHRRDNDNTFTTTTNTQEQQQQQQPLQQLYRQIQEADMPLMQHNINNSNSNNNHHKIIKNSSKRTTTMTSAAAGTRCGEIFVTHNARKWTFVCTYCNKSTRDIGAFILHLKKMHLNGIYSDTTSDEDDGDALSFEEQQIDERGACNTSGHEQDYVDYNHFLDVNVHTPAEEFNNGIKQPPLPPITTTSIPKLNETADIGVVKKRGPGRPPGSRNNPDNKKDVTSKMNSIKQQKISFMNGDLASSQCSLDAMDGMDGSSLMDIAEYDEPEEQDEKMWQGFKRASHEARGSLDADEDFDNQLLFMPPPMGDATQLNVDMKNDGDNVRTVRRQIRGTAYCALCNKTFQYYSLYRNHMTKHSNETPFKCMLCKKGFKSKQAIRYHMHTHEKEKRHKCPLCQAAYYTENQVITHLLSHENGSIFPCMVCGKILRSDAERDQHLTTHTEERPYRCEYCNKLFRLRHHLSNHLKIHRQYRCDFCKSTFISALHQRKPYACNMCSKLPHVQLTIEQAHTNANNTTVSADNTEVNPLQLFDAMGIPKPPTNCNDAAEMVSEASSDNNSSSNSSSSSSSSSSDDDDDDDDNDNDAEDENKTKVEIKSENNLTATWLNGLDNMLNNSSGSANISEKQRLPCTFCSRTYSNVSALNYHMRQKHMSL